MTFGHRHVILIWHLKRVSSDAVKYCMPRNVGIISKILISHWSEINLRFMEIQAMAWANGINSLGPRQIGCHFPDEIFKCIFLMKMYELRFKISLRFVSNGPINNIPALVQIMAWGRPGDKPLSEPMMVRLPTHICVTRLQWINNTIKKTKEVMFTRVYAYSNIDLVNQLNILCGEISRLLLSINDKTWCWIFCV